MVSAAKIANPPISNDEEIVTATPDSSSIVSSIGSDVNDGNILSGKAKSLEKISKITGSKQEHKERNRTIDNAEIVEVHQSPTKSSGGSSSTGSSTWSVKMSPIKKRFSLTNKLKRSTSEISSPNIPTEAEKNTANGNQENEKEEVLFADKDVLVTCCLSVECIFLTHTVLTVLFI